jgi:hypothetical protein
VKCTLWLLVLAGLCTSRLAGQAVITKEAPLDSARSRVRAALFVLRDSLNGVDAAVGRLERDLSTSSDVVLRSRAKVLRDACRSAARTVSPTLPVISSTVSVPSPDPAQVRAETERGLVTLKQAMEKCGTDFDALLPVAKAEELRGYAVPRALKMQESIRTYETVVERYFAAARIKVRPRKAGKNPFAG